jgi:hypothetical protein
MMSIFLFYFGWLVVIILVGMGFELCACKANALITWATSPDHFALVILKMGSHNCLPGLALILEPPDLSLPNSWVTGVSHGCLAHD